MGGRLMSPCDFWDDIGFEVPRNPYAMLWDADVNDRTERQFIASGMAQAGRLALLSEDTGAVISIPYQEGGTYDERMGRI